MGLLPLEFGDCLLDSPYFRENLKSHERQLEETSTSIKELIAGIQTVIQAVKALSLAKRSLAEILSNFQFDCLGTTLTDDEIIIASSLKQFSKFLSSMEVEMTNILNQAEVKFINPLITFRKEQIGSVKQSKKGFEKASSKLCAAQDRYISMSSKKEESLAELSDIVRQEQKNLNSCSLEYVYNIHLVQERKKFEFVEALLDFTRSWLNYYRIGNSVANDFGAYMEDLGNRVEKTRENFSSTVESYSNLRDKMGRNYEDPGLFNRMYTRQGYLYVLTKKSIKVVQSWTKYFCQYQGKTKTLTLIPYNQTMGKIGPGETIRVINCICKDEVSEKFRFSVTGHDISGGKEEGTTVVTYILQALSDQDRKNWVEAMGGTWPAVNTLQRIKADSVEENLNSSAYTFLKDCLQELENRGVSEEGLYRVGGVMSKVKKLLNQAIDPGPDDSDIDLSDPKQWESKTLASAVKQYLRDLSKPVLTYQLYSAFIAAVKHENDNLRINEVKLVVDKLPRANRELCRVIIQHLNKVSRKSEQNLMTASNLGVCFGPTLLRPKEETVASIIDIKFSNQVVEILIEHADIFFPAAEDTSLDLDLRTPETPGSETSSPHLQSSLSESPAHLAASWRSLSSKTSESSPTSNYRFGGEKGGSVPRFGGGAEQEESATPSSPTVNKCKRTHSFSSVSELSVNSLPECYPTYRRTSARADRQHSPAPDLSLGENLGSDRPRSKSYQHETVPRVRSTLAPPADIVSPSSRSQADLLSSLEMMTFLAADLPLPPSPLRRSCTLLPSRPRRTSNREITRKPPLPKLMSVNSPSSPNAPFPFPSPEAALPSRPVDLPFRLVPTSPLGSSPSMERRGSENSIHINEVKSSLDKQYGHPQRRNNSSDSGCLLSPSSSLERDRYRHLSPLERGRTVSPLADRVYASSPLPDGGYASSPCHASSPCPPEVSRLSPTEDTNSILSLSLSESSGASVSKYENCRKDPLADLPRPGDLPVNLPRPGELPVDLPRPGDLPVDLPRPGELPVDLPGPGELPVDLPGPGANLESQIRQEHHGSLDRQWHYGSLERQWHYGSSERKGQQGSSERQGHQGSSERQGHQGSSERQGYQGSSVRQWHQGSSDRQGHQGGSERQGHQGGSERQGHQGSSERQGHQGSSERQGHQGSSERQGHQGSSERQGHQGSSGSITEKIAADSRLDWNSPSQYRDDRPEKAVRRQDRILYERSARDSGPYENVHTQVSDIERDISELENIVLPPTLPKQGPPLQAIPPSRPKPGPTLQDSPPEDRKGSYFEGSSWISDPPDLLYTTAGLQSLKNLLNSTQASNV